MLHDEYRRKKPESHPIPDAEAVKCTEHRDGCHGKHMQQDTDERGVHGGEACRDGMQSVAAVERGVLQ